jgi:hypothetical protein
MTKGSVSVQPPGAPKWTIFVPFMCFGVGGLGIAVSSRSEIFSTILGVLGFGGFVVSIFVGIVVAFVAHSKWRRQMLARDYEWSPRGTPGSCH